ncbi:MAG: DUF3293 domain-containing protein [Saprospiraceae bacterium]|jgi:hypothetical protein|nr:DUF3293 domain-containing protein [Lewinellaceae bacterium]
MSKPVAVLKRLEDSPRTLDRRLVAAYLRTVYRVQDPPFDIHIGAALPMGLQHWLDARGFETFAFLTAENPAARILPEAENASRQESLRTNLLPFLPNGPYPAVHHSLNDDWPAENSWWAPGLASEQAVDLGRQYGQNALVYWRQGGEVELWWL